MLLTISYQVLVSVLPILRFGEILIIRQGDEGSLATLPCHIAFQEIYVCRHVLKEDGNLKKGWEKNTFAFYM